MTTAKLPGDGCRTQHDTIKWRFDADLRERGVRARTEVFGMFVGVFKNKRLEEEGGSGKKRASFIVNS